MMTIESLIAVVSLVLTAFGLGYTWKSATYPHNQTNSSVYPAIFPASPDEWHLPGGFLISGNSHTTVAIHSKSFQFPSFILFASHSL